MTPRARVVVIGAGIGGLTAAALLARDGVHVTVVEANPYPGGSAATFFHKSYRFDAGATVAAGFQETGAHTLVGDILGLRWNTRAKDPAWVVHLPDRRITLTRDLSDIARQFPRSAGFWTEQRKIADLTWVMSSAGLPFPPADPKEALHLAKIGWQFFPRDMRLLPFAFSTVGQWMNRHQLSKDKGFLRFIDAQLLISAQTTSPFVNALYGATALDLPRQGVFQIQGGIGELSQQLARKINSLGGDVLFRHSVSRVVVGNALAKGVSVHQGKRGGKEIKFPADLVIANTTPWSLDSLLGPASPQELRSEIRHRRQTQGAFVLHIGLRDEALPSDLPEHHQIICDYDSPLEEGNSLFLSISPAWDSSRAPPGCRAVTVSTHTRVQPWWDAKSENKSSYQARKTIYAESMIEAIDRVIPGFKTAAELVLPGTPLTYQFYTQRHKGMVGGFPQTSLLKARGPRTGIPNLLLVGDSIFPGQSTAAVTLGAIRVAKLASRRLRQSASESGGGDWRQQ